MLQFHIPLETNPVPYQNNVRHSGHRRYKTAKLKAYQTMLGYHASKHVTEPLIASYEQTFTLELHFHLKNKVHGDLDNLCKSCLDSFEGILYNNDKFCSKLCLSYEYSDKAGIDVTFFAN